MSTETTTAGTTTDDLRDFYVRYVGLANAREFDRMADFAHEEVVMNGTPVKMADMVAEFYRHVEAVPDLHWEIEDLVVEGNRLAARLTDTGTPVKEWNGLTPTGRSVSFTETAFYEVEDGKFKVMRYLMDTDGVRQQLAA